MTEWRYTRHYRTIYDGDRKMSEEEIVHKLNCQHGLIQELLHGTDITELLCLMTDNNLTWKGVTNIIKEALDGL